MSKSTREALEKKLAAGGLPAFYLDTNILRDLVARRREASVALINRCKALGWRCVTSYFTFMELFDIEQESKYFRVKLDEGFEVNRIWSSRRGRDLSENALLEIEEAVYEPVRTTYDFIEWIYLEEAGWNQAINLAGKSNLLAPDCIHLATALIAESDVLVTSDTELAKIARRFIASDTPEKVLNQVRGLLPNAG